MINQIIAAVLALFISVSSPAPIRAAESTAPSPISQVQELRKLSDYFPRTLKSRAHVVDVNEKNMYAADVYRVWDQYLKLGAPYNNPEFQNYLRDHEDRDLSFEKIAERKDATLELVVHRDFGDFASNIAKPSLLRRMMGAVITNPTALDWTHWAASSFIEGSVVTFGFTIYGDMMRAYLSSIFSSVVELAGKVGFRHWGWMSQRMILLVNMAPKIRKVRKKKQIKADPTQTVAMSLVAAVEAVAAETGRPNEMRERDGLHYGSRGYLDHVLEIMKKYFVKYHTVKNSSFTWAMMDGRDVFTNSIHWRENAVSQLVASLENWSMTQDIRLHQIKEEVLKYSVAPANQLEALRMFEELLREHKRMYVRRAEPEDDPVYSLAFLRMVDKLKRLNVREYDIDQILLRDSERILAYERITVALALQVVQDAIYLEHNRGHQDEVRKFQGDWRRAYNMGPVYKRHELAIQRVLHKVGLGGRYNEETQLWEPSEPGELPEYVDLESTELHAPALKNYCGTALAEAAE